MGEERMRILDMVREGKITAEEGVRLLEALKSAAGHDPVGRPGDATEAPSGRHRSGAEDDPFRHLAGMVAEALQARGWSGFGGKWAGSVSSGPLGGPERKQSRDREGWQILSFSEGDHGTFELPDSARLTVEAEVGSIEATVGDDPPRLELDGEAFNFAVYVARKERDVVISAYRTAHYARMPRLKVIVPREVERVEQVRLVTSGGGLKAHEFACPVLLKTSGGGIRVTGQGEGMVEARTSGGGIHVEGRPSRLVLSSSGGGIHFTGRTDAFDAKTSGGSISIEGARLTSGAHRAKTAGGSVQVRLAAESSVEINAKTSAGSIDVSLPGAEGDEPGSRISPNYHGRFNGSGASLDLSTAAGSIRVGLMERSSAEAAA